VVPLRAAAEQLPLQAASLDLVTAFNCVHHFDLGRFLAAAARVLRPGGQLFIYTRTPQQNARTIWGRYFPGFTEHEQRLHSQAAIRDAVRRTDGLTMIATQTFRHPRTSTAERLGAQAQGRHYSTFSFYTPQELRAAITAFLARLPGPEVCWVDEHLLVIAGGSRHDQAEPDGPASPASQAINDHAPQISAGHAGQAPHRRPGGRAQITPLSAQPIAGHDLRHSAHNGVGAREVLCLSSRFGFGGVGADVCNPVVDECEEAVEAVGGQLAERDFRPQAQVSGRGDSHPPALAEPGVRVSPHRAPTGRPGVRAIRCQWTKRLGWR
jgi:hypothetical protein